MCMQICRSNTCACRARVRMFFTTCTCTRLHLHAETCHTPYGVLLCAAGSQALSSLLIARLCRSCKHFYVHECRKLSHTCILHVMLNNSFYLDECRCTLLYVSSLLQIIRAACDMSQLHVTTLTPRVNKGLKEMLLGCIGRTIAFVFVFVFDGNDWH